MEDDRFLRECLQKGYPFQSTSPVWRTTRLLLLLPRQNTDFNPRPPCGGRLHGVITLPHVCDNFNPRPPCGGRRNCRTTEVTRNENISIHVPRVEDDYEILHQSQQRHGFQSTSPVWRTTGRGYGRGHAGREFQSTSPVWRTTSSPKAMQGL